MKHWLNISLLQVELGERWVGELVFKNLDYSGNLEMEENWVKTD